MKSFWYNKEYDASWTEFGEDKPWVVYDVDPNFYQDQYRDIFNLPIPAFLKYFRKHSIAAFKTEREAIKYINSQNGAAYFFDGIVW